MAIDRNKIGTVGWLDLTVPDATSVRDFYHDVMGVRISEVNMGGYDDYCLHPPADGAEPVAGVCHARGANADLPPVWLPYFLVGDLDAALSTATNGGGRVLAGARGMGGQGRYAILQDPAGAAFALFEPAD